MPFLQDPAITEDLAHFYGKYHSTFRSENEQVVAHLFERGDQLVAYVSFAPGVKWENLTDAYQASLERYAEEHGFGDRLQVIHTD